MIVPSAFEACPKATIFVFSPIESVEVPEDLAVTADGRSLLAVPLEQRKRLRKAIAARLHPIHVKARGAQRMHGIPHRAAGDSERARKARSRVKFTVGEQAQYARVVCGHVAI